MVKDSERVYIYIPGIGDWLTPGRKLLIRLFWRGRQVEVFDSRWNDKVESSEQKKNRVQDVVNKYSGRDIVFVGESAGGALAVLMSMEYAGRAKFVTICGYNHDQASMHEVHGEKHPAFYQMVGELDLKLPELPKQIIEQSLTVYSSGDDLVEPKRSLIEGVASRLIGDYQHNLAIVKVILNPNLIDK